ncbi:MAG: hypothetical protein O3C21_11135, partial [Verrucomicrobia bacterium]|nr:hypothetical protein [Verrucomicrobiota bacterium]
MKANLVLPLAVLASFGAGILADRAFLGVVGLPSPGVGSESHSSSRPDIGAHGLPVSMASATPTGEAKADDAEQPDDKELASLDERIERLENDSSPAEFARAAGL